MPEVPESVRIGLENIRPGMHLRWNQKGKVVTPGGYDVTGGVFTPPEYEPRWEVWDTDPQGVEYHVMTLQTIDGDFRQAGEWIVFHLRRMNPENYDSIQHMMQVMIDEPELLREIGTQKDSDDAIEAVTKWAQWCETPKSSAGLSRRGQRLLST